MTDAKKSSELDRLEKLYKHWAEKLRTVQRELAGARVAVTECEGDVAECELQLKNIAWSMDIARAR